MSTLAATLANVLNETEVKPEQETDVNDTVTEDNDETSVSGEAGSVEVAQPPRMEQKYRHPMLSEGVRAAVEQPKQKTREQRIDDTLTRALAAYCYMREHKTDYYDAEVEQIYDVTINLLITKMALVHDKARNANEIKKRAERYLHIYFELSQLKQAQQRRVQFFEAYKDLVDMAEIGDFVDETADEFAKSIDNTIVQLDQLIHKPVQSSKMSKPKLSLRDVVDDAKRRSRRH